MTKDEYEPLGKELLVYFTDTVLDELAYQCGEEIVKNKQEAERVEKMTNFEKIKNMAVEVMVEFLDREGTCDCCIYADDNDGCEGLECREGIKAWLEQEVTDND